MKIALVVGVNYYEHGDHLYGCVNDAHSVKAVLERHDGGSVNFDCRILTGTGPSETVSRGQLKDQISELTTVRLIVKQIQLVRFERF